MCRATELLGQLSDDEVSSLRAIGTPASCGAIRDDHAEKLLRLGFAELICGDQQLTRLGRRAVLLLAR